MSDTLDVIRKNKKWAVKNGDVATTGLLCSLEVYVEDCENTIADLTRRLETAEELLGTLEWIDAANPIDPTEVECPWCGGIKGIKGHKQNCKLEAALKARGEGES